MKNNFHTPAFDAKVMITEGSETKNELKENNKINSEIKNNEKAEEYATCK